MGLGLSGYLPYVVYVCTFIVAILTVFYRVEIGLYFLIPLIPWQNIWFKLWDYTFGTNLIDILIVSLIIGWIIQKKEQLIEKNRFNWPIVLLIVITFLGLIIGTNGFSLGNTSNTVAIWKNFIFMPIIFFITYNNIRNERQIKILIFLMALSMLANDIHFRSTFVWIQKWHFSNSVRMSTYADLGPNELSSYVVQGTMLLFGIWLTYKKKWTKIFIGIVLVGNIYVILYTYSRAGYFAFVVSCVFYGLVKDRRLLALIVLLGLFWTQILPVSVVDRIQMTTNEQGELDHASEVRIEVWQEGLSTFLSSPIGVGFAKYKSLGQGDTGKRDAHNMFVKMLVELGVQGLFVYLLLYFLGMLSGWKLYKSEGNPFFRGIGLGFIGCVLANMVCNFFGQNWVFFSVTSSYWVFLALVERSLTIVQLKDSAGELLNARFEKTEAG